VSAAPRSSGVAAQTWQRSCVMIRSGSIAPARPNPHCRDFRRGRGIRGPGGQWLRRSPCAQIRDTIRTGLARASGGKSHSWLTPATWSPSPSANRISVAEGNKEQIFMPCNLPCLAGLVCSWLTFPLGTQSSDLPDVFLHRPGIQLRYTPAVRTKFLARCSVERKSDEETRSMYSCPFWCDRNVLAGSVFGAQAASGPKTYSLKPTPKTVAWDTMMRARLRYCAFNPATQLSSDAPAGVSPAQLEAAGLPSEQVEHPFETFSRK